jgi:uncharacterized integral membrane protein
MTLMLKILKKSFFLIFALFLILVSIFNYETVKINLFGISSFDIPLFIIIYCSFFIGTLFSFVLILFTKHD